MNSAKSKPVGMPQRRHVLLLAAFAAMAPLSIDLFLPGVPIMRAELQASPRLTAATLSVFFIGLAFGQLVSGPLSDRVGRRAPIIGGLLTYTAASAMASFAPSIGVLLFARALQAVGASAVTVTGRAVVRDLFDHRGTARMLSTLALISSMAPVLAPLLGSALLHVAGWRASFEFMTAFGLLIFTAAFVLQGESRSKKTERRARSAHPLRTYGRLITHRRLLGYLGAAAFNGSCLFTYLAIAPLVLMPIYGLTPTAFALVFGVNAIGLVAANQINRLLLARISPDAVLQVTSTGALILAAGFAFFALTLLGGLPFLMALIFLMVASSSLVQSNAMAGALSVDPHRAGSIAALFGATAFGAGTVTSFIAGLLFDGTPRAMMGVIATALLGMAATLKYLALRDPRPPSVP